MLYKEITVDNRTYRIHLVRRGQGGSREFYCGRGSPLGNRFIMHHEGLRDEVCDKYDCWFYNNLSNKNVTDYLERILHALECMKEVYLSCYCVPKRCHTETIAKWLIQQLESKKNNP